MDAADDAFADNLEGAADGHDADIDLLAHPGRAAARGGRGARRGRGRGRGYKWTPLQRARAEAGRVKAEKKRLSQQTDALMKAVAPTTGEYVSTEIFGAASQQVRGQCKRELLVGGTKVTIAKKGKNNADYVKGLRRGCLSHVQAQASALATFCGSDDICHTWSTNSFDDASMWVAKAEVTHAVTDQEKCDPRFLKKLSVRGKNCVMPVLNKVEHNDSWKDSVDDMQLQYHARGAHVHAPAQVLPVANAPTVYSRWQRFTALTTNGSGEKVDPDRSLDGSLRQQRWKTVVMNKDNLQLNNILVAKQQKEIDYLREHSLEDGADEVSLLDLSCFGHSIVLAGKPAIHYLGMHTHLCRLGNILESGRSWQDYVDAVFKLSRVGFKHTRVVRMTPEQLEAQRKNRAIMIKARPAKDLDRPTEDFVCAAISSPFSSEENEHVCVIDECPLQCGDDWDKARANYSMACVLCAGGPMTKALVYRWKGYEEGTAFGYRSKRCKKILGRGLKILYPRKSVVDAEIHVVQMEALPVENQNDMQLAKCKRMIRGGKLVEWIASDTNGRELAKGLLFGEPIQHFLNATLAAETATSAVRQELQNGGGEPFTASLQDLVDTAVEKNLSNLSGEKGWEVLRQITQMLQNLQDERWTDLEFSEQEQFEAGCVFFY